MENEMELTIMRLITAAGDARSLAMQAIRAARAGHLDEADALMIECDKKMVDAHQCQTGLIFAETNGSPVPITLLMVHAQDHVMNAMTVKDMAGEMIEMIRAATPADKPWK